jgi:hypothetical protein
LNNREEEECNPCTKHWIYYTSQTDPISNPSIRGTHQDAFWKELPLKLLLDHLTAINQIVEQVALLNSLETGALHNEHIVYIFMYGQHSFNQLGKHKALSNDFKRTSFLFLSNQTALL